MDPKPIILIADDNAPTRALLAAFLDKNGYAVVQAEDGDSAIRMAREHKIAAAVVDQYMAPRGGFEFAQLVDLERLKFPMIMITAHDTSDLFVEARKHGFDQILKKPVDMARLLKMLERALTVR